MSPWEAAFMVGLGLGFLVVVALVLCVAALLDERDEYRNQTTAVQTAEYLDDLHQWARDQMLRGNQ